VLTCVKKPPLEKREIAGAVFTCSFACCCISNRALVSLHYKQRTSSWEDAQAGRCHRTFPFVAGYGRPRRAC
jgi:hypothetical protein